MMLQKRSPLLPFFNHAYNKLRQSGTLYRINEKWKDMGNSKCESDPLEPISIQKIASSLVLLLLGFIFAPAILAIEMMKSKSVKTKNISKRIRPKICTCCTCH